MTAPATTRPPSLLRAVRTPSSVDLSTWDPEDESRWDRRFAWRTLWITTYNLTLAFCAWYLVSAVAPRLNDVGFDLTTAQLYWLTAVPGLAGGLFRMVYMFLPPRRRHAHARGRDGDARPPADARLGVRRA